MPRFAVLRHESPRGVHWDFLLEMGPVLKTWALPQPPESGVEMSCAALPDHRLTYLEYEGPVSGDRGSVARWDRGTYRVDRRSDRELVVELSGEKLSGRATLSRPAEQSGSWRFSFAARQDHA
ncbi:MAG: DNA polymerase ligase N-terminal domain-containing protein [Planctomycetota bacterium]|jgi:hypothetical protein